jgi:hypothetical protein
MGMSAMSIPMNPATLAAINQLFTDFGQTLQQVLSSKTVPQLIGNEAHMIEVLANDIAHIRMLESPMGSMM